MAAIGLGLFHELAEEEMFDGVTVAGPNDES
jgi:hypothetical protein